MVLFFNLKNGAVAVASNSNGQPARIVRIPECPAIAYGDRLDDGRLSDAELYIKSVRDHADYLEQLLGEMK